MKVRHLFDQHGNHWLEANLDGKEVRGDVVSYTGIAELGPYRATTEYRSPSRVYTETEVDAEEVMAVTDYDETDPDKDWSALWNEERDKALSRLPVYHSPSD